MTALYNRYRPQRFGEVVGQVAIVDGLRSAVVEGKVAHAYLFSGPKGTGKTSIGRVLAKALNCEANDDGEPCNECGVCRRHRDLIEMNAATYRGMEMAREMEVRVYLTPMESQYKVYLLDEFHMVTSLAQNALLKVLEEPPPHVIFILTTTEPNKLLQTVRSRCQHFGLKPLTAPTMQPRLAHIARAEGYELSDSELAELARAARGDFRKALNYLELWGSRGPDVAKASIAADRQKNPKPGKRRRKAIEPGQRGRPSKQDVRRQAFEDVLNDFRQHLWQEVVNRAGELDVKDAAAMRAERDKLEKAGRIEVDRSGRAMRLRRIR